MLKAGAFQQRAELDDRLTFSTPAARFWLYFPVPSRPEVFFFLAASETANPAAASEV